MELGPYTIEEELGRGGAGVVLRGRAPDGEAVAVKVLLHPERGQALERFLRELDVHAELAREGGFVPLLDAGESPQGPYLVMPYLPGGTLRARLGAGPWPLYKVWQLGRSLARALGRAHAAGVVHRDLKPENVLFDARGRPLIADLGLAKHLHEAEARRGLGITKTGTIAGTLGYMPPEQMLDAKHVGPQADVFALGALLYECLSGTVAFPGASQLEVVNRMLSGGATPLEELRPEAPAALRAVVARCLAPDPEDRYPDGGALAAALRRAEDEAQRSARRRGGGGGARLALGLAAAGLAVAVAVALARGRAGPEREDLAAGPPARVGAPAAETAGAPAPPDEGATPSTDDQRPEDPSARRPASGQPAPEEPGAGRPEPASPDATPPTPDASAQDDTPPARRPAGAPAPASPDPAAPRAAGGLGQLAARLAGLAGLEPERVLGSDARRFVAPVRFLAATASALLGVDALGHVWGFEPDGAGARFAYRLSATPPTAFAAAADEDAFALAATGQLKVAPCAGAAPDPAEVLRISLPDEVVVRAVALGARPSLLVFAESSRVHVIDRATQRRVTRLEGHDAPVTALALAGGVLVSGDAAGRVLRWRVGPRAEDCALEGPVGSHGHEVASLALSASGERLAAADVTGTWAQWDLAGRRPQGRLVLPEAGRPLALRFVAGDAAVWGVAERAAVRWDAADPRRAERLPLGRPCGLAALDPGGTRLVFADPGGAILGLVDLAARKELPPAPGHYAPVLGAARGRGELVTIDAAGRALRWGDDRTMTPARAGDLASADPRARASIATLDAGGALAAAGERATLLGAAGGAARELDALGLTWVTRADEARYLAGTRTGELLWLDAAGEVLERRRAFSGAVHRVLVADGALLALGEDEGKLVLAAWGPGVELRQKVSPTRPGGVAALPGGRVVVGTESGQFWVYETAGAKRHVRVSVGHKGAVQWFATSPDRGVLLSAGDDGTLAAWEVGADGALSLLERRDLEPAGDRVTALLPLPEGRLLLGTARGLGVLCRWPEAR